MTHQTIEGPRMLGRYKLLDQLAVGGMAVVHLAIEQGDHALDRPVVIKQLQPDLDDESSQRMLLQEARLAARINHPNVVEIHEMGTHYGRPFIAMEYVPGVQIRELLVAAKDAQRPCPVGVAVGILMQACAGAHAAHELKGPSGEPENLVHRDLSPHNLMVSGGGHVKLLDFGVAKAAFNPDKTETGVLKGKYGYMSPEQLEAGALDRRSDIFTLATVLWEIIAGRPLFTKMSTIRTIHSVLNGPIRELSDVREGVSSSLSQVIAKALSRDRNSRYETADAFRRALQGAAIEEGLDTTLDAIGAYVSVLVGASIEEREEWIESRVAWGLSGREDQDSTTLHGVHAPHIQSAPLSSQSTVEEPPAAASTVTSANGGLPVGAKKGPSAAWVVGALLGAVGVGWWFWSNPERSDAEKVAGEESSSSESTESTTDPPVFDGPPVRVVLTPTMDEALLEEGWAPIAGYLEGELERPIELIVADTYGHARNMLLEDEADFGVLPPMLYIQAHQALPDLRLLMVSEHDEADHYDGVLVVRSDAQIETVSDLAGKRICYVNQDSTTGYHLPRVYLSNQGLDPDTIFEAERFSGSHQKAIQELTAGLCQVAATTSDFHHESTSLGGSKKDLTMLVKTGRPPNDAICASPGAPDGLVSDFTEALLRLDPAQDLGRSTVGKIERISGFSPTDDSSYDDLRDSLQLGQP